MNRLLEVYQLVKYFSVRRGLFHRQKEYVHAVDNVSFSLGLHETLGLVGESGCGKSTLARTILRLIELTSGEVWFNGYNFSDLDDKGLRNSRKEMQIIFQDPFGSLNPRLKVEQIVEEPLLTHGLGNRRQRKHKVEEALNMVGLSSGQMKCFPHEFSGGQRQRIMIARALILAPKLIIADEPVSALDVSIQAQILNLLRRLQNHLKFSYIIISHDLGIIRYISNRVAVMYLGEIVELASVEHLYTNPLHPYTKALLSSVPIPNPRRLKKRLLLEGDVPSPMNPPEGCRFHPRCPFRLDKCDKEKPVTFQKKGGHLVACHLYQDGDLWLPPLPGGARRLASQN